MYYVLATSVHSTWCLHSRELVHCFCLHQKITLQTCKMQQFSILSNFLLLLDEDVT